jgi:hypothetical protein
MFSGSPFWLTMYVLLLGGGVAGIALAVPLAIRFFSGDPLAAVFVLLAAGGWIISFRAFHNLCRPHPRTKESMK